MKLRLRHTQSLWVLYTPDQLHIREKITHIFGNTKQVMRREFGQSDVIMVSMKALP